MIQADYERVVDRRFGLIRQFVRYPIPPKLPRSLIIYGADAGNGLFRDRWAPDYAAIGMSFDDEHAARQAAIGERLERYCANFVPAGLPRASYNELIAAGEPALDPAGFLLFSDAQYEAPGFPFVRLTRDLPIRWVEGEEMTTGERALVPASLVYCNYFYGPRRTEEPPTNQIIYAGVASGPTRAAAEGAALDELIERDATMIWWQSGSDAVGIDLADAPRLRAACLAADGSETVRYHFIQIRTPFEVPVVGVLIEDTELEIIALGVACRPNPIAAALKALAESVSLWFFATGLLEPDGDIWRAVEMGVYQEWQFQPFRADRRYLDSAHPEFHDIVDLGGQTQLYLDSRMKVHVERVISPPTHVPLSSLPDHGNADRRELHLRQLSQRGFRAYSVDVTTSDVRMAGFSVVRVVVPGLYTNSPAAFPFLGGRRLYEEPAALGWIPRPLTEAEIVRIPLPHT